MNRPQLIQRQNSSDRKISMIVDKLKNEADSRESTPTPPDEDSSKGSAASGGNGGLSVRRRVGGRRSANSTLAPLKMPDLPSPDNPAPANAVDSNVLPPGARPAGIGTALIKEFVDNMNTASPCAPGTAEIVEQLIDVKPPSKLVAETSQSLTQGPSVTAVPVQPQQQQVVVDFAKLLAPRHSETQQQPVTQQQQQQAQQPQLATLRTSTAATGGQQAGGPMTSLEFIVAGQTVRIPVRINITSSASSTATTQQYQQPAMTQATSSLLTTTVLSSSAMGMNAAVPVSVPEVGSNITIARTDDAIQDRKRPVEHLSRESAHALRSGEPIAKTLRPGRSNTYDMVAAMEDERMDDSRSPNSGVLGSPGSRQKNMRDRNRDAAVRYRRKKKEEQSNLIGRNSQLEAENLELKTQVDVLKSEVVRLSQVVQEVQAELNEQKQQQQRQPVATLPAAMVAPLQVMSSNSSSGSVVELSHTSTLAAADSTNSTNGNGSLLGSPPQQQFVLTSDSFPQQATPGTANSLGALLTNFLTQSPGTHEQLASALASALLTPTPLATTAAPSLVLSTPQLMQLNAAASPSTGLTPIATLSQTMPRWPSALSDSQGARP